MQAKDENNPRQNTPTVQDLVLDPMRRFERNHQGKDSSLGVTQACVRCKILNLQVQVTLQYPLLC